MCVIFIIIILRLPVLYSLQMDLEEASLPIQMGSVPEENREVQDVFEIPFLSSFEMDQNLHKDMK